MQTHVLQLLACTHPVNATKLTRPHTAALLGYTGLACRNNTCGWLCVALLIEPVCINLSVSVGMEGTRVPTLLLAASVLTDVPTL